MKKYWLIVLIGLVLARIFLGSLSYNNDLNNNLNWSDKISSNGTRGFYEQNFYPYSAANYPPLITGVYYYLDQIAKTLAPTKYKWRTTFNKIPTILTETVAIIIGFSVSPLMLIIYLFNPGIFYNSVLWGQTEGLVAALIFIALYLLMKKKKPLWSALIFVLALQAKQSAIIFLPLYLFLYYRQTKNFYKTVITAAGSGLVYSLFFIPFYGAEFLQKSIGFLADSAQGQSLEASVNALNLWFLLGLNRIPDNNGWIVSYQTWGIILGLAGIAGTIWIVSKKVSFENALIAAGLTNFAVCMFMTRIHERHLLPSLVLLIPLAIKTKRNLAAYLIMSLIYFANLYLIWHEQFAGFNLNILKAFSLIQILIFGFFIYRFLQKKSRQAQN